MTTTDTPTNRLDAEGVIRLTHSHARPPGGATWLLLFDVGGFAEASAVFGRRHGTWKQLGPFGADGFGPGVELYLTRPGPVACSPILRQHHAGAPYEGSWVAWVSKEVALLPRKPAEPLPRRSAESVAAVRAELNALPTPPHVVLDEGHRLTAIWRMREPVDVDEAFDRVLVGLSERLGGERSQARVSMARWWLPGTQSHRLYPPHLVTAEILREGAVPLSDLAWALSPP